MPLYRLLIERQVLRREPQTRPAFAEQISMWTLRQEVGMQDGLRDCLETHELTRDLVAAHHLPPQRLDLAPGTQTSRRKLLA